MKKLASDLRDYIIKQGQGRTLLGLPITPTDDLPTNVREAFARWGVDPDEFAIGDTSSDPFASAYGNFTSSIFDSFELDKRKLLHIPLEGNDFIKRHELSHASTPYGKLIDNLPVTVAGNVAGLAGSALGGLTLGNEIRGRLLKRMGIEDPGSPLKQSLSPDNYKKLMTGVIGTAAAAYAPRFLEETTANARALKDTWDMDGLSGVAEATPALLLSQGSYMLPVLGLAAAMYRVRNPLQAASAPQKLNLLAKLQKSLGGMSNMLKPITA